MNRLLAIAVLGLIALARPVNAAELKVLAPEDRTVVSGKVQLRLQPTLAPTDRILGTAEFVIQDETAKELHRLRAVRDPKTGISTVSFDTSQLKDGLYLLVATQKTLSMGRMQELREDLTIGIRNSTIRPSRLAVEVEDKPFKLEDGGDVVVRVLDSRGKPLPGARVKLKVDKGETGTDADITDSDGQVLTTVTSEEAGTITLTVTVEGLAPVTKVIRFTE